MGFKGDGQQCEDVDECSARGGKYGHHCYGQTKCHNTMGSYECLCASGIQPEDPYNCDGTPTSPSSSSSGIVVSSSLSLLLFCALFSIKCVWSHLSHIV